ncbi:TetR family transcriptional regulator [Natranaerovirga pectinivora]|uniref:TetR family transcriptional regulator n=1 Tax=Natranaerovirga pectinivora TaxID=682400 RepID=A0A4R3MQI6_9FIRM|nr:TetR/AcrR family transcriptional regulator [Natranaerovirga pectinivora]TCT16146.1 TetR family transcriptional regulator [Natranaerovirga pectinivora]
MNGFEKRREIKKNQIIDALKDLVMVRNFKDIGVREIAERAGVSPASIYNFFGNKDELAKEVFYKYMEDVGEEFNIMVDSDLPFKEKVKRMFDDSIKYQEKLNAEGLQNFVLEDPAFKKHVEEYAHKVTIPMMVRLIDQGKAEGYISNAISINTIMLFTSALANMFSNPEIRNYCDIETRKELTQLFLYGVFGDDNNTN